VSHRYSEQFRSSHKTRRPQCGRLSVRQTDSVGEGQHEAARVHHAARRHSGRLATRGARAAARAGAAASRETGGERMIEPTPGGESAASGQRATRLLAVLAADVVDYTRLTEAA
jgi:hypothetical protein